MIKKHSGGREDVRPQVRGQRFHESSRRKFGPDTRRPTASRPTPPPIRRIGTTDKEETLRLVPLGGLEEVGRNMSFLEYKDEIVIVDMGLQFPEEETPGVDYIIPNTVYLEPKRKNIKAVVLTHGHLDHIGAVPYLTMRLGPVPIYTTPLTKALIEKRQEEFQNAPKLDVTLIKNRDIFRVGKYFEIEFFGVAHTIPDTMGVLIKTPVGNIVHFADFRIDYDAKGNPSGLEDIERVGKLGVHTFMVDSTNAWKPGRSVSEKVVEQNLENLFKKADGRIIVGIFASLLTRIAEILKIAERLNRVVALSGRSMKDNVQIAQNLGHIKIKKGSIIPLEEINKYKDNKILILSTGAQGEQNASLMKVVTGEHKFLSIKPTDTVIFSSSVIPGNERSVQKLRDDLCRQGAAVHVSGDVDLHASGHALQEDLKIVMKLLKPKFVIPVHGHYFMRAANSLVAQEAGIPKQNIIMLDNGIIAEVDKENIHVSGEQVPAYYVMVDGLGVGDVSEVVLRDRKALAEEGMIVVIVTLDRNTGRFLKNPDIISRGFIYLKENQEILEEIRKRVRNVFARIPSPQEADGDYLRGIIRDQIGQFLYNKTRRRPMILPVIIEI